jgi:ribosome-associated translation inhibitor RaiA
MPASRKRSSRGRLPGAESLVRPRRLMRSRRSQRPIRARADAAAAGPPVAGQERAAGKPKPGPVTVVAGRELSEQTRRQAFDVVARLARRAPRRILHARVAVEQLPDPSVERPAVVTATVDVGGRPVQAHTSAETVARALARVEQQLRRRLRDLGGASRARRRSAR